MVSDFIDEHSGYFRLSDEEHCLAKASDPEFPKVLQQYTTIIEFSFSSMQEQGQPGFPTIYIPTDVLICRAFGMWGTTPPNTCSSL